MLPDSINEELRRTPFKPFRLVMTDGKTYEIRHPDLIWVGTLDAHVQTSNVGEKDLWERFDIVDMRHVIRLEPLPSPPSAPSLEANGQSQH